MSSTTSCSGVGLSLPGASSPTDSADSQSASTSPDVRAGLALVFWRSRSFISARPVEAAVAAPATPRLDGMPCTSATVLRGRSRFGFLPDIAALTPAAMADPTAAPTAEASMLFFFFFGLAAGRAAIFRFGADPLRADLAERLDAVFLLPLRADRFADFRLPLRAAARDADFLLACFFAFFAGRAGFFRAMTNPPAFLTVCAK